MKSLRPGDTVGILGAGQLARMLCLGAARLGLRAHVFSPEDGPASDVCAARTLGAYEDEGALAAFAKTVGVVTYEFENVPAATAAVLAAHRPVLPSPEALAITQDRLSEKRFLQSLGIATAPFLPVEDAGALFRCVAQLGRPSILKTRRFGYDGKGQTLLREGSDLGVQFKTMGGRAAILEGFVPFSREVSVVAARGHDGDFRAYDLCENAHEHHILARTTVPANVTPRTEAAAKKIAATVAEALAYVGVIAVEMFVVGDGEGETLLVNEIAPRVHNSGHWTIDGANTSQFEQHVRAIAGLPLGDTARLGRIAMRNLIGPEVETWSDILAEPGARLHLYGKREARAGRKMGHVTHVEPEGAGAFVDSGPRTC